MVERRRRRQRENERKKWGARECEDGWERDKKQRVEERKAEDET